MKRHAATCGALLEHPVGHAGMQMHMLVERRAEPVLKRDRTQPRADMFRRITVSRHIRRMTKQPGSGCGAFSVLGRIFGRGESPFSRAISSRNRLFSDRNSSFTRSKRSTSGVISSAGTSIPAIFVGLDPSMPNKKYQNHPPGKGQFHGVIEKLLRV